MKKSRSKNSPPSTSYSLTLIPSAEEDFEGLDGSIRQLAYQQFKKLCNHPEQVGEPCGNKYGLNLTGFRSLHFARNAFRIIYKVIEAEKKVQIFGIGKRKGGKIYQMVATRLSNIQVQIHDHSVKVSGQARLKSKAPKC